MELKEQLKLEIINAASVFAKDESLQYFKDELTVILSGYDVNMQETALTVRNVDKNRDWIKRFLVAKLAKGCTGRTINYYGTTIPKILEEIDKSVDEISPDDVRLWMVNRTRRNHVSSVTVSSEFRCLSSFYAWLKEEEFIVKNPIAKIDRPKQIKIKKKAFSDIELEKIRGACETERDTAMIEILLSTWCRVTEIANIKMSDIEGEKIHVLGKGQKERTVFLNAKAIYALDRYLSLRKDDNPYLFPGMRGAENGDHLRKIKGLRSEMKNWFQNPDYVDIKNPMNVSSIEGRIRKIGRNAGVKNTHPHRFRRTGATKALKNGMPIMTVSKILGHESVATTQIYLDINDEDIELEHKRYTS